MTHCPVMVQGPMEDIDFKPYWAYYAQLLQYNELFQVLSKHAK